MGFRAATAASTTIVASPNNAAETVVCVTPSLNLPFDGAQVILLGMLIFTGATGTTTVSFRIRRGTTVSGPFIGVAPWAGGAGPGQVEGTVFYVDSPGIVADLQYNLTLQCTGASGTSTVADVCLIAMAL